MRATLLGLVSGLGVIAMPSAAHSQTSQTYVDLTGSVGYSSNPFLQIDGDSATLGRVSAYGVHSITSERGQTQLTAFVENSTYLRDYGSKQIFDLGARTRYKVSELVELFGDARFSGDIGGQLSNRFNTVPNAPPTPIPGPGGIDPSPDQFIDTTVLNLTQRQYRMSGNLGATFTMSEQDSLSVSGGAERVFFGSNGDDLNYTVINGTLGWQRVFSERTSGGARVSIQRANYPGPNHGATIITPQLTLATRFAEGWNADVAVGASFATREEITGRDHSIGPSFDASVCRTTESERYCGRASHSIQTASGQNAVKTTSAGLDYFNRLSPRDTIQARAGIVRYAGGDAISDLSRATYYTGGMSYSRKMSDRLSAGVDSGARKIDQKVGESIPIDLSLSAFIRFRIGSLL